MRRPFDGAVVITQEYGTKNSIYRKGYHTGVDYGLNTGHPLVSPTSGVVTEVGYESSRVNGRGHFIIILGDDGISHHLYHLNGVPYVRSGRVAEGQAIGQVGNSGASSGPHLHWETRRAPHDGTSDFAPGSWLFGSKAYVPAPAVVKQYVRIFGDYRSLYWNAGGGIRKAILTPNAFGGKLDYEVVGRNGQYVQIQTSFFGKGWIYCGSDVSHLTQFYSK